MGLISRYSNTLRGNLTLTGNTLGFSNNPPTSTGIATFLSTQVGLSVPGYPSPSTLNWQENGSTAQLIIPPGSTVEYAELVWGGSSINYSGLVLPDSTLNTPITFKTPISTNTITFDPATASSSAVSSPQVYYTRSQIVTNLVKAAGSGTYEVDGVPATLNDSDQIPNGYTTTAGWALIVVYSNPSLILSNINVYVGNDAISVYEPPVDTVVSGFSTPTLGPIKARIALSAMQGDPDIDQDQLLIGKDTPSLVTLSGPNNPINNFFNSQINNDLGLLDTTGSFGTYNSVAGVITPAVRSEWDITNIDASSAFVNAQTSATIRLQTNYDTFAISVFGIEIEVDPAHIESLKTVDKAYANVGDVITYVVDIKNVGFVSADNVVITDPIPQGTSLVAGSFNLSVPYAGSLLTSIQLTNSIQPNQQITMTYKVKVDSLPTINPIPNESLINYTSIPAPGLEPVAAMNKTNIVTTQINYADIVSPGNFTKTSDLAFANVGDIITYTLTAKNTGNVSANNVVITDNIPNGTVYVEGSTTSSSVFTGDPTTAITLTSPIGSNQSETVSFKVKVIKIPTMNPIPNQAKINYTYTVNPLKPNSDSNSGYTNIVNTQVNNANIKATKQTNKTLSYIGDTITYSIVLENTGNVLANNVVVVDLAPNGTEYVPNSLTVSVPYTGNLQTSINLSNPIAPNEKVLVLFNVKVLNVPLINPINNKAVVNYNYTVDPQNPDGSNGSTTSNIVSTIALRNDFSKQITDIINSIALQQAALAGIANAEGFKIQTAVSNSTITSDELLCINNSVKEMMDAIALLESVLKQKLNVINCQINPNC